MLTIFSFASISNDWKGAFHVAQGSSKGAVIREKKYVCFLTRSSAFACGKSINLSGKFNEFDFSKKPLQLNVNMEPAALESAIRRSGLTVLDKEIEQAQSYS